MINAASETPLLEVEDLQVHFYTRAGVVQGARGVSFQVGYGETLGIVGESGSGKSVSVQAVMGLIHTPGQIEGGDIRFKGRSLLDAAGKNYVHRVRGKQISMIFQDPMTSLNPVFTVGTQITEVLRHHLKMSKAIARQRALELLEMVEINAPEKRLKQYPHELSGGMRQRVMIAIGLACEPELLIADEPTTALDVTIQAQILDLLRQLQDETGMGVIFITHDLGVIAEMCREVIVMYAGRIVESAPVRDLFRRPAHPYTRGLIGAIPRLESQPKTPLPVIRGRVPGLSEMPPGCRFANRCSDTMSICDREHPPAVRIGPRHSAACWLYRAKEDGGVG